MQLKFYQCKHCGKIIAILKDSQVPTICCGEAMEELVARTSEGDVASEKHVPVIETNDNKVLVTVGSVIHPSENEHYIEWILLQTDQGLQKKWLAPGNSPKAEFAILPGENVIAAYEYCSLHKLWKAEC